MQVSDRYSLYVFHSKHSTNQFMAIFWLNNASGLMLSDLIKSTTLKQTNVLFKKKEVISSTSPHIW